MLFENFYNREDNRMTNQLPSESPIDCNINAIPANQREQHEKLSAALFAAVEAVQQLPDGYAFKLPNTSEAIVQAAKFISNERLCCEFFNFALQVKAGVVWLQLTGKADVKEFIRAEISAVLAPHLAETGLR
jgi:hypothetical protein